LGRRGAIREKAACSGFHFFARCLFRVPLLRTMHLFFAASFGAKNRVPLLRTMHLFFAASFEAKNRVPLLRTML
jgi:hypothetical protein